MDEQENILIRFIKGECAREEEERILAKTGESPLFRDELARLKQIYINQSMPQNEASDAEFADFKQFVAKQESNEKEVNYSDKRQTIDMGGKDHLNSMRTKRSANNNSHQLIRKSIYWSSAAIIIVLLALNLKFNWISDNNTVEKIIPIASINPDKVNTLYTAQGVKGEVILPDGSKVILNSDSKISYPAKFQGATREIEFSGEGYFEVQKDSLHPMIVRCNKNFRIEVYGTVFNIKSYDNDNQASATLINGSIRVVEQKNGKEYSTEINPNQSYIIQEIAKTTPVKREVDTDKVCEWKDGKLSFDATPLCEAVKIMERWHGVKFIVDNPALNNIPITANLTTESVFQIMDLLKFSADINYEIKDNTVVIK